MRAAQVQHLRPSHKPAWFQRFYAFLSPRPQTRPAETLPVASPVAPLALPKHPLSQVFTPTRPKLGRKSFIGRHRELTRIVEALTEERAHVVLYSERGRGKTSLSNSVIELLRNAGVAVARMTCDAGSDFDGIMLDLASELPSSMLAVPAAGRVGQGCQAALPAMPLGPADIAALPSRLTCHSLVCVIDEFDRISDPAVQLRLADTIKHISDRGARLLFMVIGVSDSVEQLIGSHQSIRRNIVAVQLPLLADEEIRQLVVSGAREAGFEFASALVEAITMLARGTPYIAQLLGLRVAQAALARESNQANEVDLRRAAERLVEEADPRVTGLYASLIANDGEMADGLRSVSTAEQDGFGLLTASRDNASVLLGSRRVSERCWNQLVAASVLQPAAKASSKPTFDVIVRDRELITHVMLITILESGFRAKAASPPDVSPSKTPTSLSETVRTL